MNPFINRLFAVSALLLSFVIYSHAQKQPVKPVGSAAKIGQFLKASKYKVTNPDKTVWTVADENFTAIVTTEADFVIVFAVLAKKSEYKATAESLSEMMKLSGELDQVKIVIDGAGDLILRVETKTKLLDQKEFNEMIDLVFAGTSEAVNKIGPHLVR